MSVENKNAVYDVLTQLGADNLGTHEEFYNRLNNEENRITIYNLLAENNVGNIGTFGDFEKRLGYEKNSDILAPNSPYAPFGGTKPTQPAEPIKTASLEETMMNIGKGVNAVKQNVETINTIGQQKLGEMPLTQLPTSLADIHSLTSDYQQTRNQIVKNIEEGKIGHTEYNFLKGEERKALRTIDEMIAKAEEVRNRMSNDEYLMNTGDPTNPTMPIVEGRPVRTAEGRKVDHLIDSLKALRKEYDTSVTMVDKKYGGETGWSSFWKGQEDYDILNILTGGFKEMFSELDTALVLEKAAKGQPLTEVEQLFLPLAQEKVRLDELINMQGGLTAGNIIGKANAQMPEFAMGMLFTSPIGNAIKVGVKGVSKELVEQMVKRSVWDFAKKAGKSLLSSATYAAAATPLQSQMYNNYIDNTINEYVNNGGLQSSAIDRLWKGFRQSYTDVFTESLGGALTKTAKYILPNMGVQAKLANKLARKFGIHEGIAENIAKNIRFDGPIEEFEEELWSAILSPYVEGVDKEERRQRIADAFSWENLWVTAASTGLMSAGMGALKGAQSGAQIHHYKKLRNDAATALKNIRDKDLRQQVFDAMEMDTLADSARAMSKITWTGRGTSDIGHAFDYFRKKVEMPVYAGVEMVESAEKALDSVSASIVGVEFNNSGNVVTAEVDGAPVVVLNVDRNADTAMVRTEDGTRKQVPINSLQKQVWMPVDDLIAQLWNNELQKTEAEMMPAMEAERKVEAEEAGVEIKKPQTQSFNVGDIVNVNGEEAEIVYLDTMGGKARVNTPTQQAVEVPIAEITSIEEEIETPQEVETTQEVEAVAEERDEEAEALNQQFASKLAQVDTASKERGKAMFARGIESELPEGWRVDYSDGQAKIVRSEQSQPTEQKSQEVAQTQAKVEVSTKVEPVRNMKGNVDFGAMDVEQSAAFIEQDMGEEQGLIFADARIAKLKAQLKKVESAKDVPEDYDQAKEVLSERKAEADAIKAKIAKWEAIKERMSAISAEKAQQTQAEQTTPQAEEAAPVETTEQTEVVEETPQEMVAEEATEQVEVVEQEQPQQEPIVKPSKPAAEEEFKAGVVRDRNANALSNVGVYDQIAKMLGVRVIFQPIVTDAQGRVVNGEYDARTKTVRIGTDAKSRAKGMEFLVGHEFLHRMFDLSTKAYDEFKAAVKEALGAEEFAKRVQATRMAYYADGRDPNAVDIDQEVVADYVGELVDGKYHAFEAFIEQNKQNKGLLAVLRNVLAHIANIFKSRKKTERIPRNVQRALNKLDNLLKESGKVAKQLEENFKVPENIVKEVEDIPNVEGAESRASIKIAPLLENISNEYFAKFYQGGGKNATASHRPISKNLSVDDLKIGDDAINAMVEVMKPYLDEVVYGKRLLPEEVYGKGYTTIFKNGSYGRSMENTTLCLRTLAYNDFTDDVKAKVGRPLTTAESFLASQMLYDIAVDPQCLYCYVSLDRKAYDQELLRYMNQRDAVISEYQALAEKTPGAIKELYAKFLDGRKDTEPMKDRFARWIVMAENNEPLITRKDLISEDVRNEVRKQSENMAWQIKDAEDYARGASWAKKNEDYRAYAGEILRMPFKTVKFLSEEYGLRFYSFSEYSPAFIVENMQMIRDAALRGLRGFAYTKELDFVRIFAPSGININISVFGRTDRNGNFVPDERQGAKWAEAQALREQYPNVGITYVATNDAAVEWAMAQDWVDVVIPFHIVRTGGDIADFYKWTNYSSMQSDKGAKKADIMPTEHHNDKETFLALCEERGLTPRFSKWVENPNYMKLVNETRRSVDETPALKPIFNLDAAKASWEAFVDKGGYYGGWYEVDNAGYEEAVNEVAQDIMEGKTANEVDYGRQDLPADLAEQERLARVNRMHHNAPRYSLRETNNRFNEQLAMLTEENKDNVVLSLGMPSGILRAAGVVDKPMKLYGNKVIKKQKDHGFELSELQNLPIAVANPIAVFNNYDTDDNRSVLTELRTKDGNFLVSLSIGKDQDIDFNIVASVFGKDGNKVVEWFNKGYATYIDKEKALNYLHHSAPIAEALSNPRLVSATKIVKDFENPTIEEENFDADIRYSIRQMDAPYLEAVERGDMETAQRMVMEAAKIAMPNTKVVDENGNPEVVYHQTNATIYVNRETGQNWDDTDWRERMEWEDRDDWDEYWEERDFNTFSRVNARTTNEFDGFFFAPEYDEYHEYGNRTIAAFLNIENPAYRGDYSIDSTYENAGRKERIRLQNEGYDGVIREFDGVVDEYIAFEPTQIKSADPVSYDDNGNVIPLSERFNPRKADVRYSIMGERGAANLDAAEEVTTRLDNLNVAREMEIAGKDAKAIKMATGWERGADNKWKYEVDDLKLADPEQWVNKRGKLTLKDIVTNADELFTAYPELQNVKIKKSAASNNNGAYDSEENTITLSVGILRKGLEIQNNIERFDTTKEKIDNVMDLVVNVEVRGTLLHEIQHAIQHIEGFARGGNAKMTDVSLDSAKATAIEEEMIRQINDKVRLYNSMPVEERRKPEGARLRVQIEEGKKRHAKYIKSIQLGEEKYRKLAGEVEARNVANRLGKTPDERRNTLLAETEDVAREDQIVMLNRLAVAEKMKGNADRTPSEFGQPITKDSRYSIRTMTPQEIEEGVKYSIKDYANSFKSLIEEYKALDKNNTEALADFRAKKANLIDRYWRTMTDEFGLPCVPIVVDSTDNPEALRPIYDAWMNQYDAQMEKDGEDMYLVPSFEQFIEIWDDVHAQAHFIKGVNVVCLDVADIDEYNSRKAITQMLLHENIHSLIEDNITNRELARIWQESASTRFGKKLHKAYKDETSAKLGNELLAYTIAGVNTTDIKPLLNYIEGKGNVSVDDVVDTFEKTLPLRDENAKKILKLLRNGYERNSISQLQRTEQGGYDLFGNIEAGEATPSARQSIRTERVGGIVGEVAGNSVEIGRTERGENQDTADTQRVEGDIEPTRFEGEGIQQEERILSEGGLEDDVRSGQRGDVDYRYSIRETNPDVLKQLNSGETIRVYRAMQVIDGKLYPPMSARVDGKLREPIALGEWEKAEERPDLADDKGYFKLDKGNNSSLKARYNPYIHTSLTPLNDQFSSAQDRPNLVTVEVEIPASELTSGYKADKAKDSVGKLEWKAGVVQSQLSGTRTVILSRWDRPLRIVPDSEVAERIVEMFGENEVVMPSNVVTPSLRAELEKLGVTFKETDNQGKPRPATPQFDETRYSVRQTPTERLEEVLQNEGKKKSLQTTFFDNMKHIKRLQESLQKAGVVITDSNDYYNNENAASSRAEAAIDDYDRQYVQPLVYLLDLLQKKFGMDYKAVADYLLAKHSIERHDSGLNALNPQRDAVWGRDTVEAIVNDFESKVGVDMVNDLWALMARINDRNLEILVEAGIKSRKDIETIKSHNWQYYVPLREWDLDAEALIDPVDTYDIVANYRNNSVKGRWVEHNAKGRTTKPSEPLSQMIAMGYRAIIAGENNKAKQALYYLLKDAERKLGNSVAGEWEFTKRYYLRSGNTWIETNGDELAKMGVDLAEVEEQQSQIAKMESERRKAYINASRLDRQGRTVDAQLERQRGDALGDEIKLMKDSMDVRIDKPDMNFIPNEIPINKIIDKQRQVFVYIGGQPIIIAFKNPHFAQAVNKLGLERSQSTDWGMSIGRKFVKWATRAMSQVSTTLNPNFALIANPTRDFLHAVTIHLLDAQNGHLGGFLDNYVLHLQETKRTIARGVTGNASPLSQEEMKGFNLLNKDDRKQLEAMYGKERVNDTLFEWFRKNGGQTGFAFMKDTQAIRDRVQKDIRKLNQSTILKNTANIFKGYDDVVRTAELMSRYATFLASIDAGESVGKSVNNARNITVNFGRRGNATSIMSSLYVFFNAWAQGLSQVVDVAKRNPKRFATFFVAQVIMGYVHSMILDLLWPVDDDELNPTKVPSWMKRDYFSIPTFRKNGRGAVIRIPLPQILRIPFALGSIIYDLQSGKLNIWEAGKEMANAIANDLMYGYSEGGGLGRAFVPTVAQIPFDIMRNTDVWGREIRQEDIAEQGLPDSELGAKNVPNWAYFLASNLNEWTGGSKIKSGVIDINPSNLQYVVNQLAGGLGGTLRRTGELGRSIGTFGKSLKAGESFTDAWQQAEFETQNIPLAGSLLYTVGKQNAWEDYRELEKDYGRTLEKQKEWVGKINQTMSIKEQKDYERRHLVWNKYDKDINKLTKIRNEYDYHSDEHIFINDEINRQRALLVKMMEEVDFDKNLSDETKRVEHKYDPYRKENIIQIRKQYGKEK